jgi:hypothetical protein
MLVLRCERFSPRSFLPLLFLFTVLPASACSAHTDDPGAAAAGAVSADDRVRSEADLRTVIEDLRRDTVPELQGYRLDLSPSDSDHDFFRTTVDPLTAIAPAKGRTYRIVYSTRLFDDPPARLALRAILTHELGHMHHYTTLSSVDLASFAIWYSTTNDVSAYEHATDDFALLRGKALGLEQFRRWLYDHVTPEVRAAKQHDYYTPDEIERWRAAHPEVADGL